MTEFKITAVCTVPDPKEQQRQWGQVYRLLMRLPRHTNSGRAAREEPSEQTEPSVDPQATVAEG
jgi:hypothetical protein